MKAVWRQDETTWRLTMRLDPEDPVRGPGQGNSLVGLLATEAAVDVGQKVPPPHPDAEALAALVITRPWINKRLTVGRPVSNEFAALVFKLFGIEVGPVDDQLTVRAQGSTPALAYSAGYDSTAVSVLLPDIPHVHHRRVDHPRRPPWHGWQATGIQRLVDRAATRGRAVHIAAADFEHLVHPYPSLPHWFGFAVGPLLMSEALDVGALVLGGTLETFYMDMGRQWIGPRRQGSGIDPLPALLGMPVMRPLVGVTEVGAMRIALNSDLADAARSCPWGTATEPCHACTKCIRKDMLAAVVTNDAARARAIRATERQWAALGEAAPFYMQAQLEYATSRLVGTSKEVDELFGRVGAPHVARTAWMDHAYRPAVDYAVPQPWRDRVTRELEKHLGWMSPDELSVAENWTASSAVQPS